MRMNSVWRRFGSRVASLAIVWAALAPTLTMAIQGSGSNGWVELCTVLGSRWVKTSGSDAGAPLPAAHVAEHCPYCSLQASGFGPTPGTNGLPLLVLAFEVPQPPKYASRTWPAWRLAQPRGPPHDS
jgi:hypothetical protein